jgi:hypothetical protein
MNKKQTQRALQILSELHDADLPAFMDNGDASIVCDQYGVTSTRFHRASNTNHKMVNLAQIASTIAQKETSL